MSTIQNTKPVWAKKIPPQKIARLYEQDANGIYDDELADEVGTSLYARVESMLIVTSSNLGIAACAKCRAKIPHDYSKKFLLECPDCGWSMTFGDFNDSYKGQTLHGLGALSELKEFYAKYPHAKTYAEKMLLIDFLIHTFHGNLSENPSRPVATNVIEGSNAAVANLVYGLAYGEGSIAAAEEQNIWLEKFSRSIHKNIDPSTGKYKNG
ncbi:MAG: hypothetical protein FWF03_00680 [Defluviitaleaceae bacterium]|nr:hypothetical protein [Defluviitaleaceae bacterium]